MKTATEVPNVLIPIDNPTDSTGRQWLIFKYGEADKDPWKWPKVVEYQGQKYRWMSWNSDNYSVNYKQVSDNELAKVVKK
jgi:hypothetical protein